MQRYAFAIGSLLLSGCTASDGLPAAVSASAPATAAVAARNDIPPRLQWNANFGYCGETSFISAGLYYGQWASQYEVRSIASDGRPQNRRDSQLLLGGNAMRAAQVMHLSVVKWNDASASPASYLAWVEENVAMHRPVIIGVYTNEYKFYGRTNPQAGDQTYDHIAPVVAAGNGRITFSDNGLWGPPRPYLFTYRYSWFSRTRAQANARTAPPYSLPAGVRDYAVAIVGVLDPRHETLPVRVATNVNYEKPKMRNHSTVRPKPMPLVLTVTVSDLRQGVAYTLYRYDRFSDVPDERFNAKAERASKHWSIRLTSGSSFTIEESIMSDQVAVYRAVPTSGP
ncbi:MAG TPA: hypothetical protein VFE36_12825 [Candidatus Baltobacteraceae bacterium]|nr:hypothetical protein [Candidatus Baltobacteraceae bacterium]